MAHDEDTLITEQVMATHDPNGDIDVDANFLLKFAEDILNSNTVPQEVKHNKLQLQEHIQQDDEIIISQVLRVSFEIMFNCLNNADCHSIAIYVLNLLSKYPWQAKSVMMLASFAVIFGKFKLVSESCRRKGLLAYYLALLKKTGNLMMSSSDNEKSVDDIIGSVLNLTKLTVELEHSSSMTLANYWISRFVVSYAGLLILGIESSQNQVTEQSILSTKIKEIFTSSLPLLEAKRAEENYQALLHAFENSSNIVEVLKLIFNVNNDKEKPIFCNYYERPEGSYPVGLEEFEGDGVLLLISSGPKHFPALAYYYGARGVQMIWVPIINKNDTEEHIQFPDRTFLYYRVLDPQKWISPHLIRFVVDKCGFQEGGDPIVISLDKRGRLVHSNALHMLLIWGPQLYEERSMMSSFFRGRIIIPSLENELRERTFGADRVITDIDKQIDNFANEVRNKINGWVDDIKTKMRSSFRSYNCTSQREKALWEEDKQSYCWTLKFLLPSRSYYFGTLHEWIDDENYIFLCGGNNIKQVQEFVQKVLSKFQINMKIAYVGSRRKKVKKETMECDYSFGLSSFKHFWARLQSMTLSRMQYLRKVGLDEGRDELMQGLKKLISYYEAECTTIGAWALLSKGNKIIACDIGDRMLAVMNEYEKWKDNADSNGFDQAFKDHYETMLSCSSSSSNQHPCCALNYPANLDEIPETQSCPQCDHNMHKFVTFSCYHGPTNDLHYYD